MSKYATFERAPSRGVSAPPSNGSFGPHESKRYLDRFILFFAELKVMTNIETDHATSPTATGCILVLCMRCGLRAYLKNGKQEENGEAKGIG